MFVLGLTGSIAMGKSTTAEMFRAEGVAVHDSDATVHALYRGAAVPLIAAAFPGTVRDGVVDRAALSAQVLDNPAAMKRLESIVHPLVRQSRMEFVEAARARGDRLVVVDIPLLFETGAEKEVDAVLVVAAPESVQKQRLAMRPGMTEEKIAAIIAKQMPDAEKRWRADFLIDTGGTHAETARQVHELIEKIVGGAAPASR